MKITKESLLETLVLLVESNHIIFDTVKAEKNLGLEAEQMEVLPFTLEECSIIMKTTKQAHDILLELSDIQ